MTHTHTTELPHGTYGSYAIGFLLSVALTLLSFWLAPSLGSFAYPAFVVFALAQLGAQLYFFLHLGRGADKAKNAVILAFTIVIIFILVVGSLWIINNLSRLHMLPPTTQDLYQNGLVAPQNELK
jgi:cytochrome o ubiquinol oxidase operon protein cyoD